jgi:hypothetical protein
MKVQRIQHLRVRGYDTISANGGCTVILDGDTETTYVKMRVAFCNPKDVFNKRIGRQQAEEAPLEVITLRSLPGVLGGLWREIHRRAHQPAPVYGPNFEGKIRDFLPKD